MNNAFWNARNPWQGDRKKVLCVCSAGLLRSPTAARVIAEEWDMNTRAVGCEDSFALIPLSPQLFEWADMIVCMTKEHLAITVKKMEGIRLTKEPSLFCLDIADEFGFMETCLQEAIKERFSQCLEEERYVL